jgi:hypothetical protein
LMTFTRTDYEEVAVMMQSFRNTAQKYALILWLCNLFKKDSHMFQCELFIETCEKAPQ